MQWNKIEINEELIDGRIATYLVQHLIELKLNLGYVRGFPEVTIKTNAIRGDTNITSNFSNNYQIPLGLRESRERLNDLRPNY